jgi:gamma-glutamylcyclotransferase (GGCT)/AIG2-like uncharacterized protein YtfP
MGILAKSPEGDYLGNVSICLPFFVYGTLLPGEVYYRLWREAIQEARPAVMTGARLYDLGKFPMLVEAPAGEVRGMAVWVRPSSYAAALALLDQLEGVHLSRYGGIGYRRAARVIRLAGGSTLVAWVYVGHEAAVAGLRPIGSDWKSYRRGDVKSL